MSKKSRSIVVLRFVAMAAAATGTSVYAEEHSIPFMLGTDEMTGGEIVDFIEFGTYAAIGGWSSYKPCNVTPAASHVLLGRMHSVEKSFAVKAQVTEPYQRPQLVTTTAWAYMDELAYHEGLSFGRDCEVTEGMVEAFSVPDTMFNPKTGYLYVDGTEKGAEIKIDGRPKGQIDQTFVLTVGLHQWETMDCGESVDIEENKTTDVFCER